jgi:hypothetical protein
MCRLECGWKLREVPKAVLPILGQDIAVAIW